jgi:hypothetical protein
VEKELSGGGASCDPDCQNQAVSPHQHINPPVHHPINRSAELTPKPISISAHQPFLSLTIAFPTLMLCTNGIPEGQT